MYSFSDRTQEKKQYTQDRSTSKMKSVALLLFIVSFVSFFASNDSLNNATISWIPVVEHDQIVLMRPDPVGHERTWNMFLCRAEHEGNYYSGKLRVNRGEIICYVAADEKKSEFQMLESFPGALNWLPFVEDVPSGAVVASIRNLLPTYVCRAYLFHWVDLLIPGWLDRETKTCYVPMSGQEFAITKSEDIEILVISKYGQMLGAQQIID